MWLTQSVAGKTGLTIDLSFDRRDQRYDPDAATAAFRIVQEALTNVVRHGAASRTSVKASHTEATLALAIADDVRGIDPSATARGRLGLAGMRERARLAGGSVEVVGNAGRGTTVTLRLPLSRSKAGSGRR